MRCHVHTQRDQKCSTEVAGNILVDALLVINKKISHEALAKQKAMLCT